MVIIFMVRIYYLKMRFVKGFARFFGVQFCSPIEQISRTFMSDSSMDMKEKSPCTATFKANSGFSGSPLQNDYFVVSSRLAAKTDFRQCEIHRQKFCRRGWRPPASFTVAVWSNRLPGEFSPMIPNHAFIAFRDQDYCHDFLIVRIYYLKMRFIWGFAQILAMQFCDAATQRMRNFLSDSSTDMKQKSQYTAETRRMALWKN
jgi:hypothetical protein